MVAAGPADVLETIVATLPGGRLGQASEIARERLADVDEKIARLKSLRAELARISKACDRGSVAECRVMEAISTRGSAA